MESASRCSQEAFTTSVRTGGGFEALENSSDPLDGLHLVLDARNVEYVPFLPEEAFVLMIHRKEGDADASEQGIMIPTNRATYIRLEKVREFGIRKMSMRAHAVPIIMK